MCRDTISETVHEVTGQACLAHLRTVGHLAVKRVVVPWEGPLGVGVASSLTLPLLDTLLPVRRSNTLRGTLSRPPMLLHAIHVMFNNIYQHALLMLILFRKMCSWRALTGCDSFAKCAGQKQHGRGTQGSSNHD